MMLIQVTWLVTSVAESGWAVSESLDSQIYEGVMRMRVQGSQKTIYGHTHVIKRVVFSTQDEVFYLCDPSQGRILSRYVLFSLRVLAEGQADGSHLMGRCLHISDLEFTKTPQDMDVVTGYLRPSQDQFGYELIKTNQPWLAQIRNKIPPSPMDVKIHRFVDLPQSLKSLMGIKVMVVVVGDISRRDYHKLAAYYVYPAEFNLNSHPQLE